ncbi:MAG: hypothetical protein UU26_C0014G0011 [Candidatus Daviesbacteria bacterium GW2011_GWC1_40_9]|nr:MAG: hypothetical protein UU26_C0014G0011 [Candidatus Daviesbacteria bacterium GW2011_GWC1_40_9]
MPCNNSKVKSQKSKFRKKLFLFFIVFSTYYILHTAYYVPPVLAQNLSTDVSNVYEINDKEAKDGDILITTTGKGIIRASLPYDYHLFGVLQNQPLLAYRRGDNKGQPVARFGNAQVNVTTLGGAIKAGDYITSSEIPGKGQKAIFSGYIIGVALAPFTETEGQKITQNGKEVASGKVPVALRIEYAELSRSKSNARLLDSFNVALFQNMQDPNKFIQVLRYIAAATTALMGFGLGFLTFSRSVPKGIEAIGRNPLAEKAILFSIALNIIFTVLTASLGIVAAAFILRL